MRAKGINYDTGFFPDGGDTRPRFDPELARRELRVIAEELHCSAVRISGGDPARLTAAAEHAAAAGLEIWYSPFPCELAAADMLPYFADCAERAESLRAGGAEVVLVTGCELSAFAPGFLPGATTSERIEGMSAFTMEDWSNLGPVLEKLSAFLAESTAAVRERFHGKVTYAAAPWEFIDWTPFDIVSVDAYRASYNTDTYSDEIRGLFQHGKPVAVTEFGTCAYQGAADRGGMAWAVTDWSGGTPRVSPELVRDESEQVRYLNDLLAVYEAEGVDAAFWFTFAGYARPHDPEPGRDLDLGSYGVVKMLDEVQWEPKEVFHAMAAAYRE
ncbi:hypothetical protein [Actinomadura rudentiformis]|uniref:Abortive infection protein n=1 Tax=Actinomadura rudentiformis TaxID=359158 RepID=A0A6H9YQW8_9ACTN|nr:hypothetical protein [Actinomadura rudentiformis]KAB2346146.1 hypothetical protein F8566_26015 [Actinomadura rudentiformis]